MALSLTGIGISNGIAIGKVTILRGSQFEIPEYSVAKNKLPAEKKRFQQALRAAKTQLGDIYKQIPPNAPADVTAFIDTHMLMLDDSTLSQVPLDIIEANMCNAEWALKQQRDALVNVFEEMDDPYLRTRKDDVDHVVNRIQRILLNYDKQPHELPESNLKDHILLADDLAPADAVLIMHQGIAGFITELGGPTSHTAILARSLRIPGIVGLRNAHRYVQENELLILDGMQGSIIADPDERSLRHYRKRQREVKRYQSQLIKLKTMPSVTRDGEKIALLANIELPEDLPAIKKVAAAGVGLYRTEFLFMNRADTPTEDEHFRAYQKIAKSLKGSPVTIRTLDLGADKQVDGGRSGPAATNPALGLRAIRLCLKNPSLFRPQLRAILRVSAYGNVRMMIPMLCNLNELFQVLQIVDECKRELRRENIPFDENMPVGGMIEIPAAALSADAFAKHLDFLSIGTNDLIQYTLAIDRIDDDVNYLYDPLHPAVLQLIQHTIRAGKKAGIPVAMCGEMAGDARYSRLLLGMGLREFSMHPSSLLSVKKTIHDTELEALKRPVKKIMRSSSRHEIQQIINRINQDASI